MAKYQFRDLDTYLHIKNNKRWGKKGDTKERKLLSHCYFLMLKIQLLGIKIFLRHARNIFCKCNLPHLPIKMFCSFVENFCGPLTYVVQTPLCHFRTHISPRSVRARHRVSLVAKYPYSHSSTDPVKICLVKHLDVFEAAYPRVLAQSIKSQRGSRRIHRCRSMRDEKRRRMKRSLCVCVLKYKSLSSAVKPASYYQQL